MGTLKGVFTSVGAFAIGFVLLYLLAALFSHSGKKGRKQRQTPKHQAEVERRIVVAKLGTMNLILIIMGVLLFLFTQKMIDLFETYQETPDTLITCVFALCGGECGVMGWIKNSKEQYRDRKWEREDRQRFEGGTSK